MEDRWERDGKERERERGDGGGALGRGVGALDGDLGHGRLEDIVARIRRRLRLF